MKEKVKLAVFHAVEGRVFDIFAPAAVPDFALRGTNDTIALVVRKMRANHLQPLKLRGEGDRMA